MRQHLIEVIATALRDTDLRNGHCDTETGLDSYLDSAISAIEAYDNFVRNILDKKESK